MYCRQLSSRKNTCLSNITGEALLPSQLPRADYARCQNNSSMTSCTSREDFRSLEICWQFAAGLPAFSSLPFFSNSDPNLSAKLAPFSDPRQGPEKGSLSFFSRQCPNWGRVWGPNMGSRFGTQFWGPNLGPPSHAFLVAGPRATGLQ